MKGVEQEQINVEYCSLIITSTRKLYFAVLKSSMYND